MFCFQIIVDSHALVRMIQGYPMNPPPHAPSGNILQDSSTVLQSEWQHGYCPRQKACHHPDPPSCFKATSVPPPPAPVSELNLCDHGSAFHFCHFSFQECSTNVAFGSWLCRAVVPWRPSRPLFAPTVGSFHCPLCSSVNGEAPFPG